MNKTVYKVCDCNRKTVPALSKSFKEQPARKNNINALVAFFTSGNKQPNTPLGLGIELEHIVVRNNMEAVSYEQPYGIAWLLKRLQKSYPTVSFNSHGNILGLARPGERISIEPAAQVEISMRPYANLAPIEKGLRNFEQLLDSILKPVGEKALTIGYHPSAQAHTLTLIPQTRYAYMTRYLDNKDSYGSCMMRGSAATQVSIDYTDDVDCTRKLRIALTLAPLFSLICDNTTTFEGKPRTQKMVRTAIWQHVDNDRCGAIPSIFDPSFSLAHYAAYVLDTPAILVPHNVDTWRFTSKTFGEVYANRTMTRTEIEHALSMFFNDVRLKTYIEIRPADSMPIPYVVAYSALIKGLFYSKKNLTILDELLSRVRIQDFKAAKKELMQHGYKAHAYGYPASKLCDYIFYLAKQELSQEEQNYLAPLEHLVAQRQTLADIAECSFVGTEKN